MYDFNDEKDVALFKSRLQEARKGKSYNQKTFAEALHFSCRSSIGNWESQKSTALPTLENFVSVCKLLDVDPNFMLGVSDIPSENDVAISNVIGLSSDNVNQLRNNKSISDFINYILSSAELNELVKRIEQICHYGYISEAQETTFAAGTLKQIQKAFDEFYRNVFPLDMSVERFAEYIRKEVNWNPDRISIDDFVHSVVTENEYHNILFEYPDFESKTDQEKYDILIVDIAKTSYDYMMGQPMIELAERKIAVSLSQIVSNYVDSQVENMKAHVHKLHM